MKHFVLIDGHSLLFRAYHGLPKTFTDREGRPVNAVYGFMSMLLRVINDLKPDFLMVAFDEGAPTLRHADLVTYKEGRPEMDEDLKVQQPIVRELLQSFSVPTLSIEGYEGEDIIATAIAKIRNQKPAEEKPDGLRSSTRRVGESAGLEFYIVSGDRDVLQLVNREVKVYSPKKGISDPVIFDENNVKEVFGVKASAIPDYKGLRGDPTDRIPGVFGIGEKTAVALIDRFGSIENLYQHIGEVRGPLGEGVEKKLAEGAEMAVLSKKLATIYSNAPLSITLSQCHYSDFKTNISGLNYLSKLNFKSLVKRLTGEEMPGKQGQKNKSSDAGQVPLL